MARMYPYQLDPATQSGAEKKLFPIFKECLDEHYMVFHGKALQELRPSGGVDDREIDFLVAHPAHGLLAIEVKGGRIRIDGYRGEWVQDDRTMKKNPVEQARSAAYALHRYLEEQPETRDYNFPTWYAVGLPDVDIPGNLAPDALRAILLDKRDFRRERITAAIEKIYQHYRRRSAKGPGEQGLVVLARTLAPSHFLRSYLARDFEDEEQQIKALTEEQFEVLSDYEHKPRLLITGCAGSGKTMLAVEKARRLVQEDKRVLLTCYNSALAGWLNEHLPKDERLTIRTFHQLCIELCARAGRELGDFREDMAALGITKQDYYNGVMPNALREAVDRITTRFDAIIVDEGQDFRNTYWPPLVALLNDPERGTFYIFCDDNQRIYTHDALPFQEPSHHLSRNLRNTLEIGQMVGRYHQGRGRYKAVGPESKRAPQFIDLSQFPDKDTALAETLETLMADGVKLEHIVMLTPLAEKSHWKDGTRIGRFTLVRGKKAAAGQIAVETIFSFKGLEHPVVILSELDRWLPEDRDSFLYVALSRARNHLVILGKLPEPGG